MTYIVYCQLGDGRLVTRPFMSYEKLCEYTTKVLSENGVVFEVKRRGK